MLPATGGPPQCLTAHPDAPGAHAHRRARCAERKLARPHGSGDPQHRRRRATRSRRARRSGYPRPARPPAVAIRGRRRSPTSSASPTSLPVPPARASKSTFTTPSRRATTRCSTKRRMRRVRTAARVASAQSDGEPEYSRRAAAPPASHLYAHCLRGRPGGVAVLAINLDEHGSRVLKDSRGGPVLCAPAGSHPARSNAERLPSALGPSTDCRASRPRSTRAGELQLAPASVNYIALTGGRNEACSVVNAAGVSLAEPVASG